MAKLDTKQNFSIPSSESERDKILLLAVKVLSESQGGNVTLNQILSYADDINNKLTSRIDNIASAPAGSTTGDLELIDIRQGADGVTYKNAGAAVRTQILNEKTSRETAVSELKNDLGNEIAEISIDNNKYILSNGNIVENEEWWDIHNFDVSNIKKIRVCVNITSEKGWVFYDSNNNVISGSDSENYYHDSDVHYGYITLNVPNNASKLSISNYRYQNTNKVFCSFVIYDEIKKISEDTNSFFLETKKIKNNTDKLKYTSKSSIDELNEIIKTVTRKSDDVIRDENGDSLLDENGINLSGNVYTTIGNEYYKSSVNPPYWILFLDCARKYFSINNLKKLIELASENNFKQICLHFSEDSGFRLALDNMTIKDVDGDIYDLSVCLGGSENPNKYYTQSEMDNIINFANSRGIEIVPSLDLPGHLGRILNSFPNLKYQNTTTLDITNDKARKFGVALLSKYCKYFSSRGCKFFNIGYDEIGNAEGFQNMYNNGEFEYVESYANELIKLVKEFGFTPRIFNEVVYYEEDYNYYIDKDAEVLIWKPWSIIGNARGETILNSGYRAINATSYFYWILQNEWQTSTSIEELEKTDILRCFDTSVHSEYSQNCLGAMYSIWCDGAESINPNDNGDDVITRVTPFINAFGNAIKNFYK